MLTVPSFALDAQTTGAKEQIAKLVTSYVRSLKDTDLLDASYAIGQELAIYTNRSDEIIVFESARIFPIYKDNNMWAVVTMVNANTNKPSYTIDCDYLSELQEMTVNGSIPSCLFVNNASIYVYNADVFLRC